MLAVSESHNIQRAEAVEQLEATMLELPQAECPVVHHFGPGIYIREVTLPAGILAIGHAQRFEHLNIMLKGAVVMVDDQGQLKTLRAPLIFTGKPGRKLGYVLEETVWQNVYATEERDVDVLEATYLDKSATWQAYNEAAQQLEHKMRQEDRDDFAQVVEAAGFDQQTVRAQSENLADQISIPHDLAPKLTIRDSTIEGKGVFVSSPVAAGEVIAPARIRGLRTPAGRYTNHSRRPNAIFMQDAAGDIWLVASRPIHGCAGGDSGEEVTVDYRQALSLSGIYLKGDPT